MESKKILVADDENNIVQVIAAKLRNNGYEVFTADNGAEACKLYRSQKLDAVVIDCDLTDQLDTDELDIPVTILTTNDAKPNIRFTEQLNKPFSPKEILTLVENVLTGVITQ